MKIPKRMRSYCPSCKTHQEIVVERVKKGQQSSMTHIARQKRRQQGIGNSGKFSKVPGGDKPTKRIWLRYRCTVCKKAYQPPAFRAKKFEFKE